MWDYPVDLEPPFEPYGLHHPSLAETVLDDGRKPTFLSAIADQIKNAFVGEPNEHGSSSLEEPAEELFPPPFSDDTPIRELAITLPAHAEISREYAEHLLLSLGSCALPLSFEILSSKDRIIIQFACREADADYVKQQLQSFFPEANIANGISLDETLNEGSNHTVVVDYGLSEEFIRPLKTYRSFNPDPLTTLFGALENVRQDECGLVQVLFKTAEAPWASSILRAVRNNDGSSFFFDAPEMVALAESKVERPLFSVVLRLIGQSKSNQRAWDIVRNLHAGLAVFSDPISNELIPLENDGYDDQAHLEDVMLRQTHRSGMLLNGEELLGLVHFPAPTISSPKLKRDIEKTRSVPVVATRHDFILGENTHRRVKTKASLNIEQRLRHIHIIGKTGTGKSTLLVNMIKQDIEAGRGIAVLDPHGDLIDKIVELIPEERIGDVILLDPSDTEYPIGFNILEAHSEIEQTVLSSDLVELFRRFSTSWGDQMTAVLANAVMAIVESKEGGTLVELKRFLLERDFREHVLKQGVDSSVVYFWEKEFPLLKGGSQVSIITRLDAFLRSKLIRNILSQKEGLNFRNIIENKKVFLAKLSQGIIGEENAYLLGSLICSKLHQVVMGRQTINVSERTPFFFYVDEFQHFATPSMASILSGSRKYAFGLTLVHQELHQIADIALANSIITNPATRICFALGDNDAQKLQTGFAHFDANDLMNLGIGEAIVRIERNEYDFNLTTFNIPVVASEIGLRKQEKVIVRSREQYGRSIQRSEIEVSRIVKEEIPPLPVEAKQVTRVPIETKGDVQPRPKPISLTPQISIPSDNSANRKALSQHRYLQTLIKKMAEQRGYRAVIEEPTPDGAGRVDVGLERDGERIACEISVTTSDEHELHNIEKCLRAGYDKVLVCSPEKKNLETIRKLITEKLSQSDLDKVKLFEPEELFLFLDDQVAQETSTEQRIKGYRVKVQYQAVSEAEKKQKREAVAQIIVQAMRRMKQGA